ncbi:DUF1844 domain-containing protein [Candidatus Nitrospira inopinata]|jgi:hypothetical protein|uniref:DUF1844 domain-containing protein n=1 Tax=Candidatus Nitrospira inopinata TaxID=1715989 RepID=A0A0S4KRV4_9BACT|nr:DUF1844 domain-containing protein [Candidatus Nitrospira inopinata]CUQ67201.1 conserved protein of unknown function [Candidatus Nitrospira inopinata]
MSEQEQGFVVRDRRGSGGSGTSGPSAAEETRAASSSRPDVEAPQEAPPLPVTFSSFVISLGSSALMLMGEQLDPRQEAISVNLPQAKEIIDLLSVLEEKTKGNLTSEEQTVLRDMLYALRLKYVALVPSK